MELAEAARDRLDDLRRLQKSGLVCSSGDFFPSVHYPPITMYPPIDEETLFAEYTLPGDGLLDLYVHIPFCIRQCHFCHYPVKVGATAAEKDRYLAALEQEMELYRDRLGIGTFRARSILIAGGTPTHLAPAQLDRFLGTFAARVDMGACTQYNVDLDPPTLLGPEGAERLRILQDHGIDRFTIGVQAMDDDILRRINRPHTVAEAAEAVERSMSAGFRVNVEFIYGLPGQTVEGWIRGMEWAVSLGTEEIQLYRLKVAPYGDHTGNVASMSGSRPEDFPSLEETLTMKRAAALILEAHGYRENLCRVFTRHREDYSHYADNQCCGLLDQVGFGLTAFSSLRDRFGLNTMDFTKYYEMIGAGRLPVDRGLVRTAEEQCRWALILPLKNRKVYKEDYRRQAGICLDEVFREKIGRLKAAGLLCEDARTLALTELGRFFADEVCQQFHSPAHLPFLRESYADGDLNPFRP